METTGNSASPEAAPAELNVIELHEQVWKWVVQGNNPDMVGCGQFPIYADDPLTPFHKKLDEYLEQMRLDTFSWRVVPKQFPVGVTILEAGIPDQLSFLRSIAVRILFHKRRDELGRSLRGKITEAFVLLNRTPAFAKILGNPGAHRLLDPSAFGTLVSELLRSDLPFAESDLISLIEVVADQFINPYFYEYLSPDGILRGLEQRAAQSGLSPLLRDKLRFWQLKITDQGRGSSKSRKLLTRINGLLGAGDNPGIEAGEAWSNASLAELKEMSSDLVTRWCKLFQHCQQAEGPRPTQKWTTRAHQHVEAVGRDEFKRRVLAWFDLVALPRPVHQELRDPRFGVDPDQLITDVNSVILKGLAWACVKWEDPDIARSLSRLAQVCFKKVRNLGARCPRVGNACVYSLSLTTTEAATGELTRLNQVVKQPSARKLIGKSLDKAAELNGQTREDLEESMVPNYGLDAEGCLRQTLGEFTAEFRVCGPDALVLNWRKADGKIQKSIPAEVKASHAADLKALKRTAKDIERMLPAQRQRIERQLLAAREWEFEKWQKRYLNHPLLADLSRRLIWHFQQDNQVASGIWQDGRMVDALDQPVDWLTSKTRVRLWHPLGQEVDKVVAWRRWLETHEVTQPFKQAHREIYVLTDAELQTGTHSNRFAAHIIRQHQFAALATERGWTYRLQGAFDSHNVPTLLLPQWDLAVEFWVESPGGHEDTSQAGIYLHLATDQVRFCDMSAMARPLDQVPALVFSEVMRDVDLFVGVCSVGNDPEWQDRGEAGPFGGYWQRFSFGDLSAPAKTRREVLERLLPRLKIASQCELRGNFLVVQGSLRTYKIHLGSSNILMEPNDRYLCIVPERGRATSLVGEHVFLPFDGDNTLAVILSKAFLLAEDAKIKDPTIISQLARK